MILKYCKDNNKYVNPRTRKWMLGYIDRHHQEALNIIQIFLILYIVLIRIMNNHLEITTPELLEIIISRVG